MTRPAPLLGVDRARLDARAVARLNKPGSRRADVLLVRDGPRELVVKDFGGRGRFVRRVLGPWLVRRELRAYRRLEGLPGVPRVLGRLDECAFVLEYRPGEMLTRALRGRLPPAFLPELRATVRAMHARGVVHGDLRHRSNVLVGRDGRPVVLDLATSLCFRPGGWGQRWLQPLAARVLDLRALDKWQRKFAQSAAPSAPPAPAAADELAASKAASLGSRGASRPM